MFGTALLYFALTYMFAFPKGGIKIFDVPVTIGYLISVPCLLVAMLRVRSIAFPTDRALILLCCSIMTAWALAVVYLYGTRSGGYTAAFFTGIFYLPVFGLVFFSSLVLDDFHGPVERALLWVVRFLIVYGLFLFVYRTVTGGWIEIPYLTVNADDLGTLDDKFINRGGIFKLISTYNNGNIFGVSMCIIGPLYLRWERSRVLRALFYVALILTLSRTVWIGLILIAISRAVARGFRPSVILSFLAIGAIAAITVYNLLSLLGRDISFIFDTKLGGRVGQLSLFTKGQWLPDRQVRILPEIVYAGIVESYGFVGLILFVLLLLITPLMLLRNDVRLNSLGRASACLQGVLIYVVLAGSDAAFSYIPVMMVYWSVAGLGLWYGRVEFSQRRLVGTQDRTA